MEIAIRLKCTNCGGDGQVPVYQNGEITGTQACTWPGCVNGYIETGAVIITPGTDDILDKCNDILNKHNDVMELLKHILEQLKE